MGFINGKRPDRSDHRQAQSQIKGVGLIEVSIFMILFVILWGAGTKVFYVYNNNVRLEETDASLKMAQDALNAYWHNHGRFPCPADRTAALDSPGYGTSVATSTAKREDVANPDPEVADPLDPEGPPPPFDEDTATFDCVADPAGIKTVEVEGSDFEQNVFIGALPTRTLGLPDSAAVDGWSHRLVYAVSDDYSSSSTSDGTGPAVVNDMLHGQITILDSQNNAATASKGRAIYLVLAPGEDTRGAYSAEGKKIQDCDPDITTVFASNNCDDSDSVFGATTIKKLGLGEQTFSTKMVYFAGYGKPPPVCETPMTTGDALFLIDTSGSMALKMPNAAGVKKKRTEVIKETLVGDLLNTATGLNADGTDGLLKWLIEKKKLAANAYIDIPSGLSTQPKVGIITFKTCQIPGTTMADTAARRLCIFTPPTSTFSPLQVNGDPLTGIPGDPFSTVKVPVTSADLDNSLVPLLTLADSITPAGSTALYRKMMRAARALGEGVPGHYNTLVVLSDGMNNQGVDGGDPNKVAGVVKWFNDNYPNLRVTLVALANPALGLLYKTYNVNVAGVPTPYQLNGDYIFVNNGEQLRTALQQIGTCL